MSFKNLSNTKIQKNLFLRSKLIQSIRQFFLNCDYLEVETPYRIPSPIPEAFIYPIASENFLLHTSPELYMKRMLASGYPKIFQICKCFRKNERGDLHLPEFTMLEWYCAGKDYFDIMDECEKLIIFIAQKLGFGDGIIFGENKINLQWPWIRLSVEDAFERYACSLSDCKSGEEFDEKIVFEIEPKLDKTKPVFLYDYPPYRCALARLNNKNLAERFELYVGGIEIANAFSELNNEKEQRKRFQEEIKLGKKNGRHDLSLPENFLKALAFMPDSGGIALGIDRLTMLFCNEKKIDNVVAFTPEEL